MDHTALFSSAQAIRSPAGAKYMPLARPAGSRNVDSRPSVLHFRMRSLGWSVNSTFPSGSHVGPSVNAKPPASFSTVASGATTRSPVLDGIVGLTGASTTAGLSSETQCYPASLPFSRLTDGTPLNVRWANELARTTSQSTKGDFDERRAAWSRDRAGRRRRFRPGDHCGSTSPAE